MRWKMNEIFERAEQIEQANYPINPKECVFMAVRELVPEYVLIDTYTLYGITLEEYIEDTTKSYLRYKNQKLSELWQRASLEKFS